MFNYLLKHHLGLEQRAAKLAKFKMTQLFEEILSQASSLIQKARSIVVLSGAGLSRASGLPSYRNQDGLWSYEKNLRYSHAESYLKDPKEFLSYWSVPYRQALAAKPNPAHYALRRLQQLKPNTTLITQNIDGLLQKAGCNSVLELHGSLRRHRCVECRLTSGYLMERCLRCGSNMRPDVVLFGEMLDEKLLLKAKAAASKADLLIVVGTTAEVYPASTIPFDAKRSGANILVLDIQETVISGISDVEVLGAAEDILPLLVGVIVS